MRKVAHKKSNMQIVIALRLAGDVCGERGRGQRGQNYCSTEIIDDHVWEDAMRKAQVDAKS